MMDLTQVKLKKVIPVDRHVANHTDEEKAYQKQICETNVESWYPYLKDHTMKTWFVPLTVALAEIFQKQFFHLEKGGPPLSAEDEITLKDFCGLVDECMSQIDSNQGAFIRCSTRSPKDSQVSRSRCRDILKAELTPNSTSNQKLASLLKAALGGMKSYTGVEAVKLLTTSERIYEDLCAGLEHKETFKQLVIIREWLDIPIANEFRGFVYNSNLNAISQYYHTIFFEELPQKWEKNIQKIREFFEEVKVLIPLTSYIIDFAILPNGRILVIELNPFSIATDPNLFSWKEDIEALRHGPFVGRFTPEPLPTTKGVDMAIEDLLDENPTL